MNVCMYVCRYACLFAFVCCLFICLLAGTYVCHAPLLYFGDHSQMQALEHPKS